MTRNLQILFVLIISVFSTPMIAQLANGSIAPDWTLTDLNGTTYNLYDELDAGKSIVLDISATWCPPCWTYHTSGVLEELYEQFGPNGTDEIRVFMVEGDSDTNLECLFGPSGCNDSTMGDWVTGTPYPIFSPEPAEADAFISDYQLAFWPTIYGISPLDNTTQLVGQASASVWESWLIDSWQMSASATAYDSDCPYSGMVEIDMTNGYGELEYEWSNGDNTEVLMDVPAGTYSVTITDDHDVSIVVDNITVGGTSAPALAVSELGVENVNCNGESNGSLEVLASGGSGSFSYVWNNGMVGSYIDNLPMGNYEVTCTDAQGCQVINAYEVTEPSALAISSSITSTSCGDENGFIFLSGSGGNGPYYYDIGFGSQLNGTFASLPAGEYMAQVSDFNGCVTEELIYIEESVAPQATAESSQDISCLNEQVEVSAANSTYEGNVSIIWSTTDGTIDGESNSEAIMVSSGGTYTVVITELINGCSTEASVMVADVSELPTVEVADADEITCTTSQVTIDGSLSDSGTNLTYEWTTTDGNIVSETTGAMIDVDQGGTYTLNVLNNENGCSASKSVEVIADNDMPTIAVEDKVLTCSIAEVEICATVEEGNGVVWNTGAGEVSQTCITVTAAGEYTATVTAPNGCTNTSVATISASTDLPVVSIEDPNLITCTQESIMLTAMVDGGIENSTVAWNDADGNVISVGMTEVSVSAAGVYEFTVTNDLGCTTVQSVTVEEDINSPIAEFDYTVDSDGVVSLISTSAEGGVVTWLLVDGSMLTGEDASFTLSEGGEYEVCMTYSNECGSDESCQTVVFSTILAVSLDKSDLTCYQSNDGSIDATATGGSEGYSYLWSGPDGFTSTESSIENLAAGTYELVVTDSNGSEIGSEATITEPSEILVDDISVSDDLDGLSTGSISIVVSGGTGALQYLWSNGATTSSIDNLEEGEYSVVITDENGCSYTKDGISVGATSDIEDLESVIAFNMFPNPAINNLQLDITFNSVQDVTVVVYDAIGKLLLTKSFNTSEINHSIDVSNYNSGLYTLSIIAGDYTQSESFIVLK